MDVTSTFQDREVILISKVLKQFLVIEAVMVQLNNKVKICACHIRLFFFLIHYERFNFFYGQTTQNMLGILYALHIYIIIKNFVILCVCLFLNPQALL